MPNCKSFFFVVLSGAFLMALAGCSTNPATGQRQFTALMSPQQEEQVGASEHEKIKQQYGFYEDAALLAYVREVGRKVVQDTERPDVSYQFFILDSPIVNAFALPGGYIYVSRGLLALANSEAQLAAVLAHETGHITARHSAERYSQSVVTSLGAAVLSAAVDNAGVSRALGLGSNLYLSSYSRSQENEADTLGLRYMTRGGYHPQAMAEFLTALQNQSALEDLESGGKGQAPGASYFSTHPATAERISKTRSEASQYAQQGISERERYLDRIAGLIYGDSPKQGYVRGQSFIHPVLGFAFDAPAGYRLINQPSQVVAASQSGNLMVFDMVSVQGTTTPAAYISQVWMKGERLAPVENISINGLSAATAAFPGKVNGQPSEIRLIAIAYAPGRLARFQIAMRTGVSSAEVEQLKTASYSFRTLTESEKSQYKPYRLEIVTAGQGDTVQTLARRFQSDPFAQQRFRVLNGLGPQENVVAGRRYKIVTGG